MLHHIQVTELHVKLTEGNSFLLIDVREPYEYEAFNLGAQLFPMGEILSRIDELLPYKDREIVIYCRSGKRSAAVQETLQQLGFTQVSHIQGGIEAWIDRYGTEVALQ